MEKLLITLLVQCLFMACGQQKADDSRIVTSDIDNFWLAYDQITSTSDSAKQYTYLKELYFDKGTAGLEAIRWARRYTAQDYINAINGYPAYWNSIREKTLKSREMANQIDVAVDQLREIYPDLQPGNVYFEIGVFRTPGTTFDSLVLIGAEMALGDEFVDTSELPDNLNYVKEYLKGNPVENIVFLNVHEFIHTQQKDHDYILLYRSIYEGIAEWVAEKATGVVSQSPAIRYGKANSDKVRAKFEKHLYGGGPAINNWLYNGTDNEFGTRDLGYYVGYAICDGYYSTAEDKRKAIVEMIELDYSDDRAFNDFVDKAGFFSKPLKDLKSAYELKMPTVTGIKQFENGSKNVPHDTKVITIEFSEAMNSNAMGFDFGPLGADNALYVQNYLGFSDDGMSVSFELELKPGHHYQLLLSDDFINLDDVSINPYLIDIQTAE